MANKMTLKDYFAELRVLAEGANRDDLVQFIDKRVEQINKKNKSASGDRKPTATQVANEGIKAKILAEMKNNQLYTVGEMIKTFESCNGLSSSKVTALVHQLVKAEKVVRTEEKGKAYFAKA